MVSSKNSAPGLSWLAVLFVALALSIGWGVRGNWGHEYGAMIPGALAAMAAVLVSGRDDWHRRIGFFAFYRRDRLVVRRIDLVHAGDRLHALGRTRPA